MADKPPEDTAALLIAVGNMLTDVSKLVTRLADALIAEGVVSVYEVRGEVPKHPKTVAEWNAWERAQRADALEKIRTQSGGDS